MCKQDPLLSYLNKLGYNVIKIPRTGIKPGMVLARENGIIHPFGHFNDVWKATKKQLPEEPTKNITTKLRSQVSSKVETKTGVDLLDGFLSKLSGTSVSTSAIYAGAKSIQIEFDEPTELSYTRAEIGEALEEGYVKRSNKEVSRLLIDGEGELFVIYQVITSNKIFVHAFNSSETTVEVDVSALENLAKGSFSAKMNREFDNAIEYKKEDAPELSFGFMIYKMNFDNGSIFLSTDEVSAKRAFGTNDNIENQEIGQADDVPPFMFELDTLIDVEEK